MLTFTTRRYVRLLARYFVCSALHASVRSSICPGVHYKLVFYENSCVAKRL